MCFQFPSFRSLHFFSLHSLIRRHATLSFLCPVLRSDSNTYAPALNDATGLSQSRCTKLPALQDFFPPLALTPLAMSVPAAPAIQTAETLKLSEVAFDNEHTAFGKVPKGRVRLKSLCGGVSRFAVQANISQPFLAAAKPRARTWRCGGEQCRRPRDFRLVRGLALEQTVLSTHD